MTTLTTLNVFSAYVKKKYKHAFYEYREYDSDCTVALVIRYLCLILKHHKVTPIILNSCTPISSKIKKSFSPLSFVQYRSIDFINMFKERLNK